MMKIEYILIGYGLPAFLFSVISLILAIKFNKFYTDLALEGWIGAFLFCSGLLLCLLGLAIDEENKVKTLHFKET